MPADAEPTLDGKECSTCKFYEPRYYGVGVCGRQNTSGSKIFTMKTSETPFPIFVAHSFLCIQYEQEPPIQKEIL